MYKFVHWTSSMISVPVLCVQSPNTDLIMAYYFEIIIGFGFDIWDI